MSKKSLATATAVTSMLKTNSIVVEIGGSIRRITLDNFMNAIQTGALELRQYAWGVPIMQSKQSSPAWGRVGNLDMWAEYKSQMGRYLLTNDGLMAKLSASDSTKFADGTTVDETKGHIVFHAPRLYYLVKEDSVTGVPYLWGSMQPISGHYIEAPTIGAYKGYVLGNKLVSRSGYAPTGNNTIYAFWTAARANGNNFGLTNYDHRRFMKMISLFEFGNANDQVNVGYGCCGDGNTWDKTSGLLTGATASLGDACGSIDISSVAGNSKSSRVNLFGLEDPWGWQWEFTQGIYCGNSGNDAQSGTEVFIYQGNRLPSDSELKTTPSGDFRQLTRLISDWMYIKEETLGEYFDLIPSVNGGDSNSYWADAHVSNATGQVVLFGGTAGNGAACGLASVASDDAWSGAWASYGSRLAYYGTPTIVNGADL